MKVRIVSLASAVLMVGSLIVTALAPTSVSAGTLSLSAETVVKADVAVNQLLPGSDVTDMATVGSTIYAVSTAGSFTLRSTDNGTTWSRLSVTGMGGSPMFVTTAPGDASIVLIADSTANIFYSTDGGSTFTPMTLSADPLETINDIAISPVTSGNRYLTVAGINGGVSDIQYLNVGGFVSTWTSLRTSTGWSDAPLAGNANVLAIAYSPNFAVDKTLVATTTDGSNALVEIALFSMQKWNAAASFVNYPKIILASPASAAAISLSPTYLGADESLRVAFVGVSTGAATGRLLRLEDTAQTTLVDGADYGSVAFNGTDLVAGRNDNNGVSYSANPTASTPTVTDTTMFQRPGGAIMVKVAWSGTNVVAGTSGASSAFAVSGDKGATFNDIALIDTTLTNMRDVAVSADGNTVYLVTDNGAQTSVWRKSSSAWQRVLNPAFSGGYLIRIDPQSANNTYLFDTTSTNMFYSGDSGEKSWLFRALIANPVDAAVESAQVAYALSANGVVYKSTTAGFIWSDGASTGLGNGATITSIGTNQVLVGGSAGNVAWSTDGGSTWTRPSAAPFAGGTVQVTADNLTNGRIYAATSTMNSNIMRWQIGVSTFWSDIISGTVSGGATGIAMHSGALYVVANESGNVSAVSRTLIPTTASITTTWSKVSAGNDVSHVVLNRMPSNLKSSTGPKLWATNTAPTGSAGLLYSLADTVAENAPNLTAPADGFQAPVNQTNGLAYDIAFSWSRLSLSTGYNIQIALDQGFTQVIVSATTSDSQDPVVVTVSGNPATPVGGQIVGAYGFVPGSTYYWRVKSNAPMDSQWSSRSFGIAAVGAAPAGARVSVDAPNWVPSGCDFTVAVDIEQLLNFDAATYQVSFNATSLRLDGVTAGDIGGTAIPVDMWSMNGTGKASIVQNVPGTPGVTGSGQLAVLHFHAVGPIGSTSMISLSDGVLSNNLAVAIPAIWINDSTDISFFVMGDANGDGTVNALDITKVERIIVGLD